MSVPKKPFVPVEPSRHMPPNVYFLYGNDEFAISQRLREFEVDFPDPSSAEMNITHLDARSMTESELNTAVNAMPFLAPKRLIFLCDPSVKYIKPGERRKFEGFLEKVPETAKLVCYETIEPKEAPKHWLVKWVAKNNKLVQSQTFMLPRHREMTGWIVNETKSQSGEIEASAAAKLAEMVGTDTRQASQEIAKLLAFNNWDRPISLADVAAIGLVTSQESLFDFVDALASGNGRSAQHLLQRLLEEEDPFALWGMVVRQFRLLLQAREVRDMVREALSPGFPHLLDHRVSVLWTHHGHAGDRGGGRVLNRCTRRGHKVVWLGRFPEL